LLWDEKSLYDNITLLMGSHKGCQGKSKVIIPKCYKHLAYALTCFILNEKSFKAKFESFKFYVEPLFSADATMGRNSNLEFVFP
jgi:hypothetical protein